MSLFYSKDENSSHWKAASLDSQFCYFKKHMIVNNLDIFLLK